MVLRYSIVHILGLHNRVRANNQINRLVELSAQDIGRISKDLLNLRPVITKDIVSLQKELQLKKNNVVIFPITTSIVYKDAALLPLYNMNPPSEVSYRNLYFYVPALGYDRVQTLQDVHCAQILKEIKMPIIPEYPIAGTEIQKENLLRKYLC